MGVTAADIQILERLIKLYQPRRVLDLGAQNNFTNGEPMHKAPYMSEWWKAKNIHYNSIDKNGLNGSMVDDLSEAIPLYNQQMEKLYQYDFVMDFGTSEHIEKDGSFSWEAIYNCWLNKHNLLRTGGIMVNENPKTGNWPGHGFNYYTSNFYMQLCTVAGYVIVDGREIPAMSNTLDGWNVFCVLRKFSDKFPSLEEFQTLDLRKE